MSKLFGRAIIKAGGKTLRSAPGASIDIGGVDRNPVIHDNGEVGFSEVTKPSMIECEVSLAPGDSLVGYGAIADDTVTFECDTGQTYVQRNGFCTETPKATGGEGGKVPLKFAGPPAVEVI